jgi:hypothetical protein
MKFYTSGLLIGLFLLCIALSPLHAQIAPQRRSFELSPNEIEPSIRQGSMRVSTLTNAPLALYAPGFAVSTGTPEEMARQYLSAQADVLHLRDPGLGDLTTPLPVTPPMAAMWCGLSSTYPAFLSTNLRLQSLSTHPMWCGL